MANDEQPLLSRPSADELRPYIGQWVVIRNGKVSISADTATEAVARARERAGTYDMFFRVPEDPVVDIPPEV